MSGRRIGNVRAAEPIGPVSLLKNALWIFIVILLLALPVWVFLPKYLNASASQNERAFCESVEIGDAIGVVTIKAERAGVKLATWSSVGGAARHQAWFTGFLGNASSCEIFSDAGLVTSKYSESHTW